MSKAVKTKSDNYDFENNGYRLLFLQWLQEWKQEAAATQNRIQYSYAKAHSSLKSFTMPVYSGHGCIKLSYFGEHTCKKLEKKLVTYLKENKLQRVTGPDPFLQVNSSDDLAAGISRKAAKKKPAKKRSSDSSSQPSSGTASQTVTVSRSKKSPRKRLIATEKSSDDCITISETEMVSSSSAGQSKISSSEMDRPEESLPSTSRGISPSFARAKEVIPRPNGLVFTRGVTKTVISGGGGVRVVTCSSEELLSQRTLLTGAERRFDKVPVEKFVLTPGSFDVVLCVDNQEIHSRGNTRSKLDIVAELKKQNLSFSCRSLKVGDFLWIAQEKETVAARDGRKPRELILDFIAERKRGDDLAVSIKDGRYTCQKYRMKTTGLRRIIYIVEEASRFQNKGLSDAAFHQALANIVVQDGFLIKQTDNMANTADYLLMMTQFLQRQYSTKILTSCSYQQRCAESGVTFNLNEPTHNLLSFAAFSAIAKTNQTKTISQAFLLQLLALDGVSPAKASAIVAKYPTIRCLIKGYDECRSEEEKSRLLRDIPFGSGLTKIGPSISKKLYHLYCTPGVLT